MGWFYFQIRNVWKKKKEKKTCPSCCPGFICVVLCLWSSIILVSRQLAAFSCSPTLHHHRNLCSVWMVTLSFHPSAHHPKTEIHSKHNRAVETNKTRAERCERGVHTDRGRALTPDASAQQSKCEGMCALTITQTHTSGSKSCNPAV